VHLARLRSLLDPRSPKTPLHLQQTDFQSMRSNPWHCLLVSVRQKC